MKSNASKLKTVTNMRAAANKKITRVLGMVPNETVYLKHCYPFKQ